MTVVFHSGIPSMTVSGHRPIKEDYAQGKSRTYAFQILLSVFSEQDQMEIQASRPIVQGFDTGSDISTSIPLVWNRSPLWHVPVPEHISLSIERDPGIAYLGTSLILDGNQTDKDVLIAIQSSGLIRMIKCFIGHLLGPHHMEIQAWRPIIRDWMIVQLSVVL